MVNISHRIREWSFRQPHQKALIFEEPPKTASGEIQKFMLKETDGNHQIPSTQQKKWLGHELLNNLMTR
jgi:hypothetical protein